LDSLSGKNRYILTASHPELFLSRAENGRWYYSDKTAQAIPKLHREVYPFGTHKLLTWLPQLGTNQVLGLYTWQLATILIIILLAFLIHKVLSYIFGKGLISLLHRMGYAQVAEKFILPIVRPISLLAVFSLVMTLVPLVQLQPEINHWVVLVLKAALPFLATVVFYRLVDLVGIYMNRFAERTESTLDDQLVPLVRKALRTFVVVVGALFILDNLNFDVTAFLAGLSIGGLAFALAAQDTIKNFFGSLMIFVDKPFQIGDWITSGEIDGSVEEVGFRSTRIRTFRNSVTYVPNGTLADSVVDNHGLRQYRRFYTKLALTYDTPPRLVELFVEGLKEIVKSHPATRKDYYEIHLNELGAHSLDVMFYIFFTVPSWSEELKARHQILLQIMQLAETLGVRFAFPTQTLHMETLPGQASLTPEYTKAGNELQADMQAYLQSIKN
jgi:MscS family membrane protein